MSRTLRLIVEYDGKPFSGWQIQEGQGAPPTVQGMLEAALAQLTGETIRVRGASRTDAGVHARGQTVAFETARSIPALGFERGLRTFLPVEIVVRRAEEVAPGWDPRRSSRGKRYVYTFWNDRSPSALERDRAWWVRPPLDLAAMQSAAEAFVGTHDFGAFRAAGCVAKHAVRSIYAVECRKAGHARMEMEVIGNAFVRNMVRIMAGTLSEVGAGRRPPEAIAAALEARSRASAGVTAPAHGLCLEEVIYDERLPPRPDDDADIEAV